MNPAEAMPAKPALFIHLQALLRTACSSASITQRSVIASGLTICTLLVSGTAVAPMRHFFASDPDAATTASAIGGAGALGAVAGGGLLADGPATSVRLSVSMQPPSHRDFLATQMVLLGETGASIPFSDGVSQSDSDALADGTDSASHESTGMGRSGGSGGAGSAAYHAGLASAMTAAWSGAGGGATSGNAVVNPASNRGSGSTAVSNDGNRAGNSAADKGAPGRTGGNGGTSASGSSGNGRESDCGSACMRSEVVMTAPPTAVDTGKSLAETTVNKPRPGASPPPHPPTAAGTDKTPSKSLPTFVETLPAASERELPVMAAASLPAAAVPEPGSLALLVAGMASLLMLARRRHALQPARL